MKKILLPLILLSFLFSFVPAKHAFAEMTCQEQCKGTMQVGSDGQRNIVGESYKCCIDSCNNKETEFGLCVGIDNPLGDQKDVKDILASILKVIVEIVLPVVVVMVIYSGFLYVLARGNAEAIEKAHKTLTWTLIGAAILLGAQLIANVLIDTVSSIATDSGYNTTNSSTTAGGTTTSGTTTGTGGTTTSGTTTGSTTTSGTTTGGGTGTNPIPSYVKNLKFTMVSETSTTSTGTFSYDVDTEFTPDAGKLELFCYGKGSSYTLDPVDPIAVLIDKKLKTGSHTTPSYTIKGAGDHACYVNYYLSNDYKSSNVAAVKIPSGTNGTTASIKNLTFAMTKEDATTSTGTFSYDVDGDFTPDPGSLVLGCFDSSKNSSLQATLPDQSFSNGKSYKTASAYTIKGAGTHDCKIGYQIKGNPKISNSISVKVPSNSYKKSYTVSGSIVDATPSQLTYLMSVSAGVDGAGITCKENKTGSTTYTGNWETEKTIKGMSKGFTDQMIVTDVSPSDLEYNITYDCAIEYTVDDPNQNGYYMSKSFSLKIDPPAIKDPIGGKSTFDLDNSKLTVTVKGVDIANNSISYTVGMTDPSKTDFNDIENVGMTCVNKKDASKFIRDNFSYTLTKNSGNSITSKFTSGPALKSGESYVCDLDFTLKGISQYYSTWAFDLKINGNNSTQTYY
jgi:hypothetical protein